MSVDLQREVLALKAGDHLCLIYDHDPAEQMPALLPFIQQGLDGGERCVYIADDQTVEQLAASLTAYGIDVEDETRRGALCPWTREHWRQEGDLSSELKAAQVRAMIEEALDAGFKGIRFAVEMTWTLQPDIAADRLAHWEATINEIFTPGLPARIICQYSRKRLSPSTLHACLSTHPVAIIGADVCPNPFYEAPLILDGTVDAAERQRADGRRVDWMISQLQCAQSAAKEREERVRAEVALKESERSRREVEALYQTAEATADELRNANRVKDEFLALVSHELRTPITTILGNANILRTRLQSMDEEVRAQVISDLHADARRLNTLIANLLLLARVDNGTAIEREPVLVGRVVGKAIESHRALHPARQVHIAGDAPEAIALAHPAYLREVLDNLLSNAEKYSPAGEAIAIDISVKEDAVVVAVLDRGIGLEADELESLFTAFYRSPRVARKVGGMGVGLAVCRRLIEVQGGQIWADPREDGGSQFAFTLPLEAAEPILAIEDGGEAWAAEVEWQEHEHQDKAAPVPLRRAHSPAAVPVGE